MNESGVQLTEKSMKSAQFLHCFSWHHLRGMVFMKQKFLVLAAALLFWAGCDRNQGGVNSPAETTEFGERGVTNNLNPVGSSIGPLGATSVIPYGATSPAGRAIGTGTTSELIIEGPTGQSATDTQPNRQADPNAQNSRQ